MCYNFLQIEESEICLNDGCPDLTHNLIIIYFILSEMELCSSVDHCAQLSKASVEYYILRQSSFKHESLN